MQRFGVDVAMVKPLLLGLNSEGFVFSFFVVCLSHLLLHPSLSPFIFVLLSKCSSTTVGIFF